MNLRQNYNFASLSSLFLLLTFYPETRKEVNKMFKKIVITGASAALLLGMALPAFAHGTVNKARVHTDVTTIATTGDNSIHGKYVDGGSIYTSPATARTLVGNLVNTNVNTEGFTVNKARVHTDVTTAADTGGNSIGGKDVDGGSIYTSSATAGTAVINVVNTNLSFGDYH